MDTGNNHSILSNNYVLGTLQTFLILKQHSTVHTTPFSTWGSWNPWGLVAQGHAVSWTEPALSPGLTLPSRARLFLSSKRTPQNVRLQWKERVKDSVRVSSPHPIPSKDFQFVHDYFMYISKKKSPMKWAGARSKRRDIAVDSFEVICA